MNARQLKKYAANNKQGFTLIELLISIVLFAVVMSLAAGAYTNLLRGYQQRNVERQVFEEARFVMEKIVKEIREGSVDYAYYYLHNEGLSAGDEVNYFDYYSLSPGDLISGDEANSFVNDVLVVVSPDGTERSMFWKSGYDFNTSEYGVHLGDSLTGDPQPWTKARDDEIESVLFKKMIYWSPENELNSELGFDDGLINPEFSMEVVPNFDPGENWAWYNMLDFESDGDYDPNEVAREAGAWRPITSPDVNIVDLKFIITPLQDPYKFWDVLSSPNAEELMTMQSQPKITIVMTIEPDMEGRVLYNERRKPRITIQRTVSARSYQPIYYNGWPRID